jgi:lipopolysaccharide biosynthesis glycosyltransferase
MNPAYFRTHHLTEKLLNFIRDFPELCEFWDQDALNAVLKGDFYRIDYKYNMQTVLFDKFLLQHPSFIDKLQKPIVIHFTGGGHCKPWLPNNKHPLKDLYHRALRQTPFLQ